MCTEVDGLHILHGVHVELVQPLLSLLHGVAIVKDLLQVIAWRQEHVIHLQHGYYLIDVGSIFKKQDIM